jgi:hypothetical protein
MGDRGLKEIERWDQSMTLPLLAPMKVNHKKTWQAYF